MKRLISLAAAVLTLWMLCIPSGAAFSDTESHWAAGAIDKWSGEYGIIRGYDDGTFRPDQSITRGAFAGILDRFLRFPTISDPSTFSDTAGTYWEEAILKLHASGVYLGNGGKALSQSSITRQQAVAMIARAFHIGAEVENTRYADDEQIASYAKPYVEEMSTRGYINDCPDGNFRPTDPITRAEVVNILNNMIQTLITTTEPHREDVWGNVLVSSPEGAVLEEVVISGDLLVAPGVQGEILLRDVALDGDIRNFSTAEITFVTSEPEKPETDVPQGPALLPEEVYTPGEAIGTFMYDGRKIPLYGERPRNIFSETDFYWEEDRLVYAGSEFDTQFGIDISAYQNRASQNQTIDWNAVAADGVDFVMIRIGLRGTSTGVIHEDAFYRQNIEGAMAAGLETGVYFFAQAITVEEAIEEADFVLGLLEDVEINGPVVYDWEMHDASYRVYGTTPEMATACAVAFCRRVEQAGYTPMVYAGTYVSYIKYDQSALAPYLSWYPEYKSEKSERLCPSLVYHMDYWQFSSNCYVNGIGGRVDGNIRFIGRQ